MTAAAPAVGGDKGIAQRLARHAVPHGLPRPARLRAGHPVSARHRAASRARATFVATLPGAVFSLMQFLFIPIWGRLSDRVGRRPVLLWSIAASAIGMAMLGFAPTLDLALRRAHLERHRHRQHRRRAGLHRRRDDARDARARHGASSASPSASASSSAPSSAASCRGSTPFGREGMLPPLVAAGLSTINLLLALRTLPESLPPERRGQSLRRAVAHRSRRLSHGRSPFPAIGVAVAINFMLYLWFSGMEQTFRLFTADGFGMSDAATGRIFGLVGVVSAVVQGGLVARLVPRFGEAAADRRAALESRRWRSRCSACRPSSGHRKGAGCWSPPGSSRSAAGSARRRCRRSSRAAPARRPRGSRSARCSPPRRWRARSGPIVGGVLYAAIDPRAPYFFGAVGLGVATFLAVARLR